MILSTSENRKAIQIFYIKKRVIPFFLITLLCMLISFIYAQFSHGVSSVHMTYLFLYPLVLGVLVGMLFYCFEKTSIDYFWASHLYHTGVTALVLGSLLRGIFDIAGTASVYQSILTFGGAITTFSGIIVFVFYKIKQRSKRKNY